jgi:hypothetical protein
MPTLDFAPDEDAYSFSEPDDFLYVATAGGLPRTRADIINSNKIVGVQWTCSAAMYDYLCAFNAANIVNGCEPFNVPMFIDEVETKLYVCRFVPESFKLVQQEGETYTVSAALEVEVRGFALEELDDGTTSNAGVGGGGAGYYPGSASTSSDTYTLWDEWGFEADHASGSVDCSGMFANVINIYNNDSQSLSTDVAFEGTQSLKKGAGSGVENTPSTPDKPKWEVEFMCYFPTDMGGNSGIMFTANRFDSFAITIDFFMDDVTLSVRLDGEVWGPVPIGEWAKISARVTSSAVELRINDMLIGSRDRTTAGYPSLFHFDSFSIGRSGYDYYYGNYWYIDRFRLLYTDG